jgi:hypothetical protein
MSKAVPEGLKNQEY